MTPRASSRCHPPSSSQPRARGAPAQRASRGARARQPAFGGSTRARVVARANARRAIALGADAAVDETQLNAFLDSLKYDDKGLVCAIAQDVDTGAILMQGFASLFT